MALNEFALGLKMPSHLYFRILRILKRNAEVSYFSFLDQDMLLNELPSALKNEILSITHKRILDSFSFFKGKPPQFVLDILPEFKHISLFQDDLIYRKGEWVENSNTFIYIYQFIVYFLLSGRVGFVTKDGNIFRNYVSGSYFGEVEHFKNLVHSKTLIIIAIQNAFGDFHGGHRIIVDQENRF